MDINSVKLVYFSPTGTTKKVLESIAETVGAENVEHLNLTTPDTISKDFPEIKDGLVILGAPVYAGRIPEEAAERFRKLKGDGVPAIIIVLYGNREYEDALIELRDIAVERGFRPVAAGAFIGEHSFSSDDKPLAAGRPDAQDIDIAHDLGRKIAEKIKGINASSDISDLPVPGNIPLRDRHHIENTVPVTDKSLCMMCLTCIGVCPVAAITFNDEVITDVESCILCCACVKSCPTNARSVSSPMLDRIINWLSETCKEGKKPEIFLG